MRVTIEGAKVYQGKKKENGAPYYYVEVNEPVRKFISASDQRAENFLASLADRGEFVDLDLQLINNRLYIQSPE